MNFFINKCVDKKFYLHILFFTKIFCTTAIIIYECSKYNGIVNEIGVCIEKKRKEKLNLFTYWLNMHVLQ
jgi:hypothetical protein